MQRLTFCLPQLKDRNKTIKKITQNILGNMKLLCFIDYNNNDEFFEIIKKI